MKSQELCHIVHLITTLERGGAQRILYEVVKKNKKLNYKHTIISFTEEKGFSKEIGKYADNVYHLNGKNITSFPILILRAFFFNKEYKT